MVRIIGDDTSELLNGLSGNDVILALGGDDYIRPGGGFDIIRCGTGDDTVESHLGSSLSYGGEGDDVLNGGTGDDRLYGGADNDRLFGGDGFDELFGGGGDDILEDSSGGDLLNGGKGSDLLLFRHSGVFVFTAGEDIVTQAGSTATSIERVSISGSDLADALTGGNRDDFLRGGLGDDTLIGRGGADFLSGSNGDDVLDGGRGNDFLTGGGGGDRLLGGDGDDTLVGGQVSDSLPGADFFEGGAGADVFRGTGAANTFSFATSDSGVYVDLVLGVGFGGHAQGDIYETGARTVIGSAFNDMLVGGVEQFGEAGNDRLVQASSTRLMNGGDGLDAFVFTFNRDVIFETVVVEGFDQAAGERLDLQLIDARAGAGNQAFLFIGTDAFSGAAGELRYEVAGGVTEIEMVIDTSGQVHRIRLDGAFDLDAGDFVL